MAKWLFSLQENLLSTSDIRIEFRFEIKWKLFSNDNYENFWVKWIFFTIFKWWNWKYISMLSFLSWPSSLPEGRLSYSLVILGLQLILPSLVWFWCWLWWQFWKWKVKVMASESESESHPRPVTHHPNQLLQTPNHPNQLSETTNTPNTNLRCLVCSENYIPLGSKISRP